MAVTLRVSNIPGYIQENEFKAIFAQLECQSCNLVKGGGPNGEIVGYARFGSTQAANRATQLYQGWQGFGNTDGLRIVTMNDDTGLRGKREREDLNREDPAFKQSRTMATGNLGNGTGAPYQYFPQDGPNRTPEPFNPMQGNLGPGNLGNVAPQSGFGQGSQPMNNAPFGRQPGGIQQEFAGGSAGGPDARQAGINLGSKPISQGYFAGGGNASRDMQIPGQQPALNVNLNPAAGQQQNPGLAQNNFGANQGMPQNAGIQQQNPNLGLQPNAGQFQQAPGQQGPQINNQFNPNPQPNQGQQPGNFGGFGIQNPGDAYDPQKPQFDGAQQMNNQSQNQPAASLAAALAPFLQQNGGIQNLQGLLAGQLQPNAAPQNNLNPAAQLNPMDQRGNVGPGQMQMQPRQQPQTLPQPIPQNFQPPMEQLPHDAVPTLYVDGMALDVTKREMSHIFRPFEGFKEMRMVEKKDKNGKPLIIAFAEFETPHQAAASMKTLQDYPLDMAIPAENRLRLSFAKPLKSSDPRSRGQGAPGYARPGGDGFRGNRNDRPGGRDDSFRDRGDRRDRDRERRGNFREDRVRTGGGGGVGDRRKQ